MQGCGQDVWINGWLQELRLKIRNDSA